MSMRITKKLDYYLVLFAFLSLAALAAVFVSMQSHVTFAVDEEYIDENGNLRQLEDAFGPHFVTFYDQGQKLIVKTDAKTVGDAINRANIQLNISDKVEPELKTEINANNFFINIYRAYPVMIIDGIKHSYQMTANQDPFNIAK